MTVTFIPEMVKMGRTGIRYPFVVEIPDVGQIAGKVLENQRRFVSVRFAPGVQADGKMIAAVLGEFQRQVARDENLCT